MFDLESAIVRWRQQLASFIPSATGQELEGHLREEVDRLTRTRVTTEEAFRQASARLGDPVQLSAEFAKLDCSQAWLPARLARWLTAGIAVMSLFLFGWLYLSGKRTLLLSVHVFSATVGYLTAFVLGGLGTCFVLARPFRNLTPGQSVFLRRSTVWLGATASVMTAFAIISGMFWAAKEWGRYWAWDPKETGAAAILSWTVLVTLVAGISRVRVRSLMFLSVLGNIVTALGWFVPNSPPPHMPVMLVWFLGGQLLLFAIGLLPERWLPSSKA